MSLGSKVNTIKDNNSNNFGPDGGRSCTRRIHVACITYTRRTPVWECREHFEPKQQSNFKTWLTEIEFKRTRQRVGAGGATEGGVMLLHVSFEWQQKNVNMEIYVHKPAGHTAAELDLVRRRECGRGGGDGPSTALGQFCNANRKRAQMHFSGHFCCKQKLCI